MRKVAAIIKCDDSLRGCTFDNSVTVLERYVEDRVDSIFAQNLVISRVTSVVNDCVARGVGSFGILNLNDPSNRLNTFSLTDIGVRFVSFGGGKLSAVASLCQKNGSGVPLCGQP